MRRLLSLLLIVWPGWAFARDLSAPGDFAAGWRDVTVRRSDNTTFAAVLFYPAVTRGRNTVFNPAGAPYPAITFGHGFLQPVDRYQSILEHLATWGYFVIATTTQGGLFPDHSAYADEMRFCLTYLEQENANASSPYFQRVATQAFGASGHSMGGGASILATSRDARIKALANLAAAETRPSAIAAMASVRAPVSLISGSQDTITPVGQNGQRMYDAGRAPRQLPIIQGGFHCGFQDQSVFGCDSGSMSRTQQLQITRRLLTGFFNLYLKGEQEMWRPVWGPPMREEPLVRTTWDVGFTASPDSQTVTASPGQAAVFSLTVRNTTSAPLGLQPIVIDTTWRAIVPDTVGELAAGESRAIRVSVRVPSGTPAGEYGILATFRSGADGLTRTYGRLVVRVP